MAAYSKVFASLVFPALDLVNGTEVARVYAHLLKTQWLKREELEAMQSAKLDAMLAWTERESHFYRKHWQGAPATSRPQSKYARLDGLPVVTKHDLRAALSEFPLSAYRGKLFKVHTSGSTGEPMVYYRSRAQESWFWALRLRMWNWGGYQPGEPYLTLNLNPRTALRKRVQDVLFRCSYHGFNANTHDVDAVVRDLQHRRTPNLIGYASSLMLLSRAMQERSIANPGVRTILSTGDTLLPSYRELIERQFGRRVVDYYGAGGEGFHLASQCDRNGKYHMHLENAVIEVIRDGRPATPGEMGEIVVTQLDNHAMPLIRYATQDLAIVAPDEPCECGRELPLLAGVQGRIPDIVVAPDGTYLVVHFFTILFEYFPEILQFQIIQRRRDRILARIVATPAYEPRDVEVRVRDAVARASNGSLAVDFEYVSDIPLSRSMKRRLVISEIGDPSLTAGAVAAQAPATAE